MRGIIGLLLLIGLLWLVFIVLKFSLGIVIALCVAYPVGIWLIVIFLGSLIGTALKALTAKYPQLLKKLF